MVEPMTDERRAKIKAHLAYADEDGKTMGDIYARELLAEVEQLRARADDVRAIHPREINAFTEKPVCGSCRDTYEDPMPWPCPTIAELDGLDDGDQS